MAASGSALFYGRIAEVFRLIAHRP
jgi:hypothetical protein